MDRSRGMASLNDLKKASKDGQKKMMRRVGTDEEPSP